MSFKIEHRKVRGSITNKLQDFKNNIVIIKRANVKSQTWMMGEILSILYNKTVVALVTNRSSGTQPASHTGQTGTYATKRSRLKLNCHAKAKQIYAPQRYNNNDNWMLANDMHFNMYIHSHGHCHYNHQFQRHIEQ